MIASFTAFGPLCQMLHTILAFIAFVSYILSFVALDGNHLSKAMVTLSSSYRRGEAGNMTSRQTDVNCTCSFSDTVVTGTVYARKYQLYIRRLYTCTQSMT